MLRMNDGSTSIVPEGTQAVRDVIGTEVPNPPAGSTSFFIEDGIPKVKSSDGVVTSIGGLPEGITWTGPIEVSPSYETSTLNIQNTARSDRYVRLTVGGETTTGNNAGLILNGALGGGSIAAEGELAFRANNGALYFASYGGPFVDGCTIYFRVFTPDGARGTVDFAGDPDINFRNVILKCGSVPPYHEPTAGVAGQVLTSGGPSAATMWANPNNTGVTTLVGGVSVVSNTSVTANSRVFLSVQSLGTVAVPTPIAVTARNPGTSFTITSANAVDTSVVAFLITEPV